MDYLVDAGLIAKVLGTSERDAAFMALTMFGDRAQFPIDVYTPATGEVMRFLQEELAA